MGNPDFGSECVKTVLRGTGYKDVKLIHLAEDRVQ
jgi:hypothetical protein